VDHPVRVADQVNVEGLVEERLGTPQNLWIESIGGRLVHQPALAQPLLYTAIEGGGGQSLLLALVEDLARLLRAAAADLHDGADGPLQPEAVAARERRPPLGERGKAQQLQLRRREEHGMTTQHD